MLRGRFGDTTGRPYIEAYIYLPDSGLTGCVSFLFDTGADICVLMPADGNAMGIDYGALEQDQSVRKDQSSGIGGPADNYIIDAVAAFLDEEEKKLCQYGGSMCIAKPTAHNLDIPSVLGRDITNHWRTDYDPPKKRLLANVVSAVHIQPVDDVSNIPRTPLVDRR